MAHLQHPPTMARQRRRRHEHHSTNRTDERTNERASRREKEQQLRTAKKDYSILACWKMADIFATMAGLAETTTAAIVSSTRSLPAASKISLLDSIRLYTFHSRQNLRLYLSFEKTFRKLYTNKPYY